jgi:hypothetical protein
LPGPEIYLEKTPAPEIMPLDIKQILSLKRPYVRYRLKAA